MIANIYNQDFGYAVTCDGYWAAVGNPNPFRYNSATSSLIRTGSIEVYKYNINTDVHDPKGFLYRPLTLPEDVILSTEFNNVFPTGPDYLLQTEYTGSVPYTADLDLLVDVGQYFTASEDGYGWALDMRGTLLAVGNPYFTSTFNFPTTSFVFTSSYVDLFDVSTLDINPFAVRIPPTITAAYTVGSYIWVNVSVPALQNYIFVFLQYFISGQWQTIVVGQTSNSGGTLTLQTTSTPTQYYSQPVRVIGVVGTNPYLTTIYNPNSGSIPTGSFGYAVSLNDEWLAVGSPYDSGSFGAVYMFRKIGGNNLSWSFVQTLPTPSNIGYGDNFGSSIGMNKATSSLSWSMVVGSNKASSSRAYIYEFNGTSWNNTATLNPNNVTVYPLTFYPTLPYSIQNYPNTADSFGHSVAMYQDSVIVGAPTDRVIQEYSGSSYYPQGAVYFFQRCSPDTLGSKFYFVRKSYGNENIMKDNLLGWSVSIYNQYAVAGVPKVNALSSSICYLRGSLFQNYFCGDELSETLNGQFVLYNEITGSVTSSIDWGITNIYQIKKRLLSPYRVYGWDVDISNQFIIIGSPMLISGSNTIMDLDPFTGSFTGSVSILGDLSGKAYIYNLNNLRPNFYVGNVFYRNGKIVIMTSGSNFDGLQLSNTVTNEYDYDLSFTSKQTIFEKQVVCPVDIGEFNVSTNPSAIVLPQAEFDINKNGQFDFQDCDVLLRYMAYKATQITGQPSTDWSSSIVDTTTNEEPTVYAMYSASWAGTNSLFSASYTMIDTTMYTDLDLNNDNKLNYNDMFILWKYFIYRLTQKNYTSYITPSSKNKYLSNIIDYLNTKTLRGQPPMINPNFLDYSTLSTADPTGSYLAPTVTTVGLYSGCDLVATAKLGSPIKITPDFPINFVVKMDF